MRLYMPTEVFFEDNCVANHAADLRSFGSKAFIVTGKHSSKANGSLDDVKAALIQEGIGYAIFDEVEENPSVETVAKAAQQALDFGAEFFIGVGGGSPMDSAKAISALVCNPQYIDTASLSLYEESDLWAYPVVEVPTTCGTGSEVTQYAVLTRHDKSTKKSIATKFFPDLALLDARYLYTASYENIVSTAVDALAHLIESHLSTNSSPISKIYSREGLRVWGSVKQNLQSAQSFSEMKQEDYKAFMRASMIAGIAIAHTSTTLPHGLSYPLTYHLHIPHGKAVGVFLPGFLRCYKDDVLVNEVLSLLEFDSLGDFDEFVSNILGPIEVSRTLWENAVDTIIQSPDKMGNYPYSISREEMLSYLKI